jgi:predicted nucleic acid-binding protein
VSREDGNVEEALLRHCIADNSLLVNFVHTGYAALLDRLLGEPVRLSPAVLDAQEVVLPDLFSKRPASEFLAPLYMSRLPGYSDYRKPAPYIQSFALSVGDLWEPVHPTEEELALAAYFRSKEVRDELCRRYPEIRRARTKVAMGEAETAAVAVSRGWTFLTEDQAAVELVRCLYPNVPVLRTCGLLLRAVELGYVACEEAANLFNHRLEEEVDFRVSRKTDTGTGRERLLLLCDPPRCEWASIP